MNTVFFDFETRSEADLRKVGAEAYARHPSTEILCLGIAKTGKRPVVWHPHGDIDYSLTSPPKYKTLDELPQALLDHISAGGEMAAHNASFDLAIWNYVGAKKYGFPPLKVEQVRDTMAQANAMALPGSLEQLGEVLGISEPKDIDGALAMKRMCSPPFRFEPHLFAALIDYCARDVRALDQIDQKLEKLPEDERKVWEANWRTNERGLLLDGHLIEAVHRLNAEEDLALEDMAKGLGLTPAIIRSQPQFRAWALEQGVELPDLNKKTIGAMTIENPVVLQGLEIREQVCRSSIKKFQSMLDHQGEDGRARGNHIYHRATTGRFSGSGIQVQNMPRPVVEDTDRLAEEVLEGQDLSHYGHPIKSLLTSLVRPCIVPEDGFEFVGADYSSIESKVLFWLAGCGKGLDVYKTGADLYCVTASGIFGKAVTKEDKERQIGKIAVLACGFGGGVKAFEGMCEAYKLQVTPATQKRAVYGYRDTYPEVVDYWAQCEQDALAAIRDRGGRFGCFSMSKGALCAELPSGRIIRWNEAHVGENRFGGDGIHYKGRGLNGHWIDLQTYGGDLAQSITQAVARDLLTAALVRLDSLGWSPVLHVHDEIMCEERIGARTVAELEEIMCRLPSWAYGLPITASGFVARRYRK